jgi:hypothetical protein
MMVICTIAKVPPLDAYLRLFSSYHNDRAQSLPVVDNEVFIAEKVCQAECRPTLPQTICLLEMS